LISRHLTDDETRKAKTQLLIDSYQYYLKSMNDSLSETSTTSFSSSQGKIIFKIYPIRIDFFQYQ